MIRTRIHLHSLEERIAPSVNLITDINRTLYGAYDSHPLIALNDVVFFQSTAFENRTVWRSDGTPAGTRLAGSGVQLGYDGVERAGVHYFTGHDEAHGYELWRTDGTSQGTRLVADTVPGPLDGYPRLMTAAGNAIYFVTNGNHLWRSDGTTAGTIWFQTLGIVIPDYYLGGIEELTTVGNRLYVRVNGLSGTELWTSNGTTLGTYRVTDLAGQGFQLGKMLGGIGNSLYFTTSSSSGYQLWKTDGTAVGTKLIRGDLKLNETLEGVASGGQLYFVASDGKSGNELWVTDGTANGTTLVKDINPTGSASPEELIVQGSYLYFTADDGTTGRELWRTDGTADGTIPLADVFAGPDTSDPEFLTPTSTGLYFTAFSPTTGNEVWRTDGTPEGTVQIADLEPGPASSFPAWLVSIGDRVFWVANTRADGSSLWVAGAGAGPTLLSPVPARTETSSFGSGVTIGGVHYFVAHDGDSGVEIWRTDGTAAGTWMLKDIVPGRGSSFPTSLTAVDGTLYFTAFVPGLGTELWVSDGTTAGTRLVKDIEPGGDSFTTGPTHLTAFQGKLIFTANAAGEGRELWVSDGTPDGTQRVKDIFPGAGSAFSFASPRFTELNGYLYFAAKDPDHGLQVWRTDGTEAGTTLVTDLPAPWGGLPDDGIWRPEHVGNRIVFWGRSGAQKSLWSTDGTAGGTVSLGLAQSSVVAQAGDRVVLGDKLLIWAKDATHPSALWATDGTPAGTIRIGALPAMDSLVAAGGLAYFTDSNTQLELWRTDGTAAGTYRLRTFTQPMGGMAALGGQLYFVAHDLVHGYGLWTTDGTTAGTHLVDGLAWPQPKFLAPSLFAIGDALFLQVGIVVRPGKGGSILWTSDGTEAGTHPIAPGTFTGITELDGVPVFSHDDGLTGSELWRYDPIATGADHYALENGLRLDVPAATGLLANDTDGGGKPLTATLLTKPKNGWLTLRPDGSFIYQPFSRDFSGTDSFSYRANAAGEQSPPVTVSIDVDLVNQAPVAENDTAAGRAGNPVTVRVLANDADPDNDTLSVATFTQGSSGKVTRVGNSLVYTPRVAGALTDTFTYTVRDQRGATATATVTVHLTAAPPPRVTAVRLFPGPGTGSINLATVGTRMLPFQQLSRIEVTFSADVSVTADDLRLIGADGGSYSLSGFAYDSVRRTASWTIDGPVSATWADRLTILIDGSAATGVTGPAGMALGDWSKTVSQLVGDFNGDGLVTAADRAAIKLRYGTVAGALRLFADVDGNGVVDVADADLVTANLGGRRV